MATSEERSPDALHQANMQLNAGEAGDDRVPLDIATGQHRSTAPYGRSATAMSDAENALDYRIAFIRRNISDLLEQAAVASGAATEERLAARLNDLQDKLTALLKEREALAVHIQATIQQK